MSRHLNIDASLSVGDKIYGTVVLARMGGDYLYELRGDLPAHIDVTEPALSIIDKALSRAPRGVLCEDTKILVHWLPMLRMIASSNMGRDAYVKKANS